MPTGRRGRDDRAEDPNRQQTARTRPPALPPRVVNVVPGPEQPAELKRSRVFRMAWGGCRMMFYAVVPLALLAVIAAGIVYVRLQHGPIAFDFLVGPIERGINNELAATSVKIDGAELRLGRSGELEFRLRDVSLLDTSGEVVLVAPLAAVNISTAALFSGRVVPARVELIDPSINFAYSDEQGLVFLRSGKSSSLLSPSTRLNGGESHAAVTASADGADAAKGQGQTTREKVNFARMLSEVSQRARKRLDATSYLTEFGLSNATVVVDYEGLQSSWRIDEASVDLNHARRRSIISGRATVSSPRGPWAFSFVTDEQERSDRMEVKATVRDLVPSTLSAAAPPLALLKGVDVPVAGDATVALSVDGDVVSSELAIEVGEGRIDMPDMHEPMIVSAGLFKLNYDGAKRRWDLQPSPVKWADGAIMFTGAMADVAPAGDAPRWQFELDGRNGVFEASEFSVPPVSLDLWKAQGVIVPRRGSVDLSNLQVSGGGGEVSIKARYLAGPQAQSLVSEITMSPMPINTLKAFWPRTVAPGARGWVGRSVEKADFKGGTIHYEAQSPASVSPLAHSVRPVLNMTLEASDAVFRPLPGMETIAAPRALITVVNNALEVNTPDAAVVTNGVRNLPITNGKLVAGDVTLDRPDGQITISTQGDLGPFLQAIEKLPVRAVRDSSPFPQAGEGKIAAQFDIRVPLVADINADSLVVLGNAKVTDGRFGKVAGKFDVQGFTLDLHLTETTLDAKGDLLVNGVPAKIVGQRVFGATADDQPPVKIVAKLDEADRTQLGLDLNDMVHGVVPIEVSLQRGSRPEPAIKLKADLTTAEIAFNQIQWTKASGRAATLEAEIVKGKTHETELQNMKVISDDLTAEGWIGIDKDNKVSEFFFPTLTLNTVSRLEAQGKRNDGGIWDVTLGGGTFDGRGFFRSLFNVGSGPTAQSQSKGGANVNVTLANVLGGSDTALHKLKMSFKTRSGKLTDLDLRGSLDGGAPLAAVLDQSSGQRRLQVDSADAGQAMKLVDFYPNMQGGRLRLEVNLDGNGTAEKTGVLWVENFRVLGDPVVSEVVGSADQGHPAISGKRQVTREIFDFDKLRAPFMAGYGQFVLQESYVRGPLHGATLRGKVDFKSKRVNLGGTYIPLQGLNSALGGIPLIGPIITGVSGEGIFGITFAVQGPAANPEVLVNPLSLVAPGIFRNIFQMTGSDPSVQVREDTVPQAPVEKRVRSSSTPAASATADDGDNTGSPKKKAKKPSGAASNIDGWSSTTRP